MSSNSPWDKHKSMTENLSDKFNIPGKAQSGTSPASNMSHEYEENYYFIIYGSVLSNMLIGVLSNNLGPIKVTKRTRGRLDRNVAPCSRPTANVIGPLHECKKVCPCTKALPQSGIRA